MAFGTTTPTTPFGSSVGQTLASTPVTPVMPIPGRVRQREDESITIPTTQPATDNVERAWEWLGETIQDAAPPAGCHWSFDFVDTTGDGNGDQIAFGLKCWL